MARQDIQRQNELEPKRINYAIEQIIELGYVVICPTDKCIQFTFNGYPVTFWPYSGYFSGKTIIAGRGLKNLLKQIKPDV